MTRLRAQLFVLAAAAGAVLITAMSAHAEFTSKTKSAEGKGMVLGPKLEAGGGTIECVQPEEASSELKWKIQNAMKVPAEKGPRLVSKIVKWGKCKTSSSKIKEIETSISECEIEIEDPGEEDIGNVSILTQCTATVKTETPCEVKLVTKGNSALKEALMETGGKEAENLMARMTLEKVTTEVSAGCAADGISASKEGKLTGFINALLVKPPHIPTMRISAAPPFYNLNENGEIKVTNTTPAQKVGQWTLDLSGGGEPFEVTNAEKKLCEELVIGVGAVCKYKVKSLNKKGFLIVSIQSQATVGGASVAWHAASLVIP